jgi:hypothetical protein
MLKKELRPASSTLIVGGSLKIRAALGYFVGRARVMVARYVVMMMLECFYFS